MLDAAAVCGMTETEFWESTPRYFAARQKAFAENEQRAWERARWIGYLSVLPHVDPKKRLKPTDLGRFPWEKLPKPVFEPVDVAALKKFEEEAKLIFEKQFGVKFEQKNGDNIGTEHTAGVTIPAV